MREREREKLEIAENRIWDPFGRLTHLPPPTYSQRARAGRAFFAFSLFRFVTRDYIIPQHEILLIIAIIRFNKFFALVVGKFDIANFDNFPCRGGKME